MSWLFLRDPRLRYVAKVSIAALAAYVLTLGRRNEYALFSALGAALVVGGTLGEDLRSSLVRVRGTLAGTVVGLVCALLLGRSLGSLALAVAAMASLSVGLGWGAPAMRVGLAMALVVIFSHPSDVGHYAAWRTLNTLIGIAVGLVVGRFVWPLRGRERIASAIERALAAIAAGLDALASGAAAEAVLQRQVQVLDALVEIRAARQDARVEQRLHGETDLLEQEARLAARSAVAALGASVKFGELAAGKAGAEPLAAVQDAMAALAARARAAGSSDPAPDEFAARRDRMARDAERADLDPQARALLGGLLVELQQIDAALRALADARRAAPRPGPAS